MICQECGCNINEMGMDNMSPYCGYLICEKCINDLTPEDHERIRFELEAAEYENNN